MRIDKVVTSGTFSLDGETFDVDNNVWIYGDDSECVVIDAAHDADAINAAVAGRRVNAILCTHAHDDHVNVVWDLAELVDAPVLLHPADEVLWALTHTKAPDGDLADGTVIRIGESQLRVWHTPGHAPGAVCFVGDGFVFGGDTLFHGGPGATGRSHSSFEVILESIRARLFSLPDETVVHTGHGSDTTIGAERAEYDVWVARGY